ncbi:MAG TPA: undecaprenyldiphospho-muramoylpentapeptide beta-N-acetylglucosaminyltransferase [Abditibacteriaceae bacterium]
MKTLKILVTGGGTSGHISPAMAIIKTIDALAAAPGAAWKPQYLYLGGKRGLEREIVEAAGIAFAGVETGKLRRYFSRENFTDMARIPVGVLQSLGIVRRFAPDVVLATGGYVAVPPVIAARLLRVPILIHEQTVQVGLANRINARCATRIALSFESAMSELTPNQQKRAFVSGNPVRPTIFGGNADAAKQLAGFVADDDKLPTIYITGGSQGARVINRATEDALSEILSLCRVIHQCGRQADEEQDYDRLERAAAQLTPELRRRYFVTRFVGEEIRDVFALADLVVGRAGAGTIGEICALGKPAIYVPLVPTGGDEQTRNAAVCVGAGAARVVKQSELDGPKLVNELRETLADRAQLMKMGMAAQTLAKPHAAQELAEAVVQLAQA